MKDAPFFSGLVLFVGLLATADAYAAGCTSPAGVAGDIIYNTTYNRLQYCNDATWVNAGSAASISGIGTLTSGNFCTTDGAVINCTTAAINLSTQVSGTLQSAQFPALTGDVTVSAGSLVATVAKINGVSLGSTTATAGNLLIGSGTTWVSTPVTGDINVSSGGVTAIGSSKVTNGMLAGSIALSKLSTTGTASSSTYLRGDGAWTNFGGIPGGSATHIQFNNAGAFGGDSGFTYAGSGAVAIAGGATVALSSSTTNTSGTAVKGYASASTGTTYAGYFENDSSTGTAVNGWAAASSGAAVGGAFTSASNSGTAVYAHAYATSGTTYGGDFRNSSTSGVAVNGYASAVTGSATGGSFGSASTSGTAVSANASAISGTTYGGYFTNSSSSGTSVVAVAGNAATKGLVVQGAPSQTGNLTEWKNSGGTALSVVNASGYFGIGTPSPLAPLHVQSSYDSNLDGRTPHIFLADLANANRRGYIGINSYSAGGANADFMSIEYVKEYAHWGPLVLQLDGGNVGIGTASPGSKLDVNGDVKISGAALLGYEQVSGTGSVTCSSGKKLLGGTCNLGGCARDDVSPLAAKFTGGNTVSCVCNSGDVPFNAGTATAICARVN